MRKEVNEMKATLTQIKTHLILAAMVALPLAVVLAETAAKKVP